MWRGARMAAKGHHHMMTAPEWPRLARTFLVGLGHKARQGKDTVAAGLLQCYPNTSRRVAFADAVKAVCRVNHGMTAKDPALLQQIGVGRRQTDPDIWIRAVAWQAQEWEDHQHYVQMIIIPDLRFPNEAEWVKRHGGVVLDVRRYRADGSRVIADDRDPAHESETALDGYAFNGIVDNIEAQPDRAVDAAFRLVQPLWMRARFWA